MLFCVVVNVVSSEPRAAGATAVALTLLKAEPAKGEVNCCCLSKSSKGCSCRNKYNNKCSIATLSSNIEFKKCSLSSSKIIACAGGISMQAIHLENKHQFEMIHYW